MFYVWCPQTRVSMLQLNVNYCLMMSSAVSTHYISVTDRYHTTPQHIPHYAYASRGKN